MPDWKSPKRSRNPDTLKKFRLENLNEPCSVCEQRPGVHVHHRVFRSQGGSDLPENLDWLCSVCHHAAHGIREVI